PPPPPPAPALNPPATIACFCSTRHRRRRSGPANTSTLAIALSLAPVQTPVFAPLRNHATSDRQMKGDLRRRGTLDRLWPRLQPLAISQMPLDVPPPRDSRFGSPLTLSRVHWVRPALGGEGQYLPLDGA